MLIRFMLQFVLIFMFQSAYASFLPENYHAKTSPFYAKCKIAKENWPQFRHHLRTYVVTTMPKAIQSRVDIFLDDDPEGLSKDETLGAFSSDFINFALGDEPFIKYLQPICSRLSNLFKTLHIPLEDRNADLIASFLTYTILNINNPAIYSAFKLLAEKNDKNQIIYEGESAGIIEYVVVTLSIASTSAIQILNTWTASVEKAQKEKEQLEKKARSWWQRSRRSCF